MREITLYDDVTIDPVTGGQTGTTPVVKENFVYTRDADELAESRTMDITWYRKDGVEHLDKKNRLKYYTPEQAIQEGIRRRHNIVEYMQLPIVGMIAQFTPTTVSNAIDLGAAFIDEYTTQIDTYILTPRTNSFQDAVTNDPATTHTWLTLDVGGGTTIRDYILDQLNY